MTESYREKRQRLKNQTYLKEVVSQPTQQSNVKTVVDKTSPTVIREDKGQRS
jgi:hypothetical protein